jgi:hypothetical protein
MEPVSCSTRRQAEKRSRPSGTRSEQRELRSMVKRGRRDVGHAVSTSRTGTLRGQCLADSRRSLDHQQTLPPRVAPIAASIAAIRSESAGDLRTLTATGATVRIRRTLTATTAGALALLGALLGVGGTYIVLSATYHDDLGYLSDVPSSGSFSHSSACRWPPPAPAGSSPAASHPPSPEPSSSDRPPLPNPGAASAPCRVDGHGRGVRRQRR